MRPFKVLNYNIDYTIYGACIPEEDGNSDNCEYQTDLRHMGGKHYAELPQHTSTINDTSTELLRSKVTFNDLTNAVNELVRTITNDQRMTTKVYSKIKEWTSKVRRNEKFNILFQNVDVINVNSVEERNNI